MSKVDKMTDESAEIADSQSTALAVRDDLAAAALSVIFGGDAVAELHNFDGDNRQKWKLRAIACGGGCKGADELPADPIPVKYFYVHRIELPGPGVGEFQNAIRSVLVTADGQAFAFVSAGIARDIAAMVKAFGCEPFNPPLLVRVVPVKPRRGFTPLTLVPA